MQDILFCQACKKHTIRETCDCTMKTAPVAPMRYSPQDKHAHYRRTAKAAERKAAGVL